jgi:hypothetical protein
LISLNLERHRRAKTTKDKHKVIDSIMDQLSFANCRFVKRANIFHQKDTSTEINDQAPSEYWELLNYKESRIKVVRAFHRIQKCQDSESAFARLKKRTELLDVQSNLGSDSLYIAANAMILSVKLTGSESPKMIKTLLCDAIASVGKHTSSPSSQESQSYQKSDQEILIEIASSLNENSGVSDERPYRESLSYQKCNQEILIEVTSSSNENSGGRQESSNQESQSYPESKQEVLIEVTSSSNVNSEDRLDRPLSTVIYCAIDSEDIIYHDPNSSDTFQQDMVGTLPIPSQITSSKMNDNF